MEIPENPYGAVGQKIQKQIEDHISARSTGGGRRSRAGRSQRLSKNKVQSPRNNDNEMAKVTLQVGLKEYSRATTPKPADP